MIKLENELLNNLAKIHTTELGIVRIKVLCQLGGSKNNSKHYEIRN